MSHGPLHRRRRLRHAVRPRAGRRARQRRQPSWARRCTSTAHARDGRPARRRPVPRCRRTGRCRTRTTTSRCCASPSPRRSPPAASTRPTSSGSAPTSPPARCCRPWPTARRCAELPELARAARTPTPKLWKHHAAQPQADRINALAARARRAVDRPRTAAGSPPSGSSRRPCSCSRRTRRSTPRRALDRGRRLDRLAAVRRGDPQRRAPPATRAILQDGALPEPRTSSPRSTRASPTSPTTSSTIRCRRSATGPAG